MTVYSPSFSRACWPACMPLRRSRHDTAMPAVSRERPGPGPSAEGPFGCREEPGLPLDWKHELGLVPARQRTTHELGQGGRIVTKELRWRIVALQVVLVLVLGFCTGLLFWGSSFVNGMVH